MDRQIIPRDTPKCPEPGSGALPERPIGAVWKADGRGDPARRFKSFTLRQIQLHQFSRSRWVCNHNAAQPRRTRGTNRQAREEADEGALPAPFRSMRDSANPADCKSAASGNARFDSVVLHQFCLSECSPVWPERLVRIQEAAVATQTISRLWLNW